MQILSDAKIRLCYHIGQIWRRFPTMQIKRRFQWNLWPIWPKVFLKPVFYLHISLHLLNELKRIHKLLFLQESSETCRLSDDFRWNKKLINSFEFAYYQKRLATTLISRNIHFFSFFKGIFRAKSNYYDKAFFSKIFNGY